MNMQNTKLFAMNRNHDRDNPIDPFPRIIHNNNRLYYFEMYYNFCTHRMHEWVNHWNFNKNTLKEILYIHTLEYAQYNLILSKSMTRMNWGWLCCQKGLQLLKSRTEIQILTPSKRFTTTNEFLNSVKQYKTNINYKNYNRRNDIILTTQPK